MEQSQQKEIQKLDFFKNASGAKYVHGVKVLSIISLEFDS